jgi:ankyrin repeat protein
MSLVDWFRSKIAPKKEAEERAGYGEALVSYADTGNADSMAVMLKLGANVNFRDNIQRTALHIAAEEKHPEALKLLLENKADVTLVNQFKQTALHLALRAGAEMPIISPLLDAGSPVNGKDTHGCTPGYYAARTGNAAAIEALNEKCADMRIADKKGATPLMVATGLGHDAAAEALTRLHCALNAQDHSGMTALMFAAVSGNAKLVKLFLSLGADMSLKNGWGKTALAAAREQNENSEAVRLLEQAEASLTAPLTGGSEGPFRVMKQLTLAPRRGLVT